MIEREPPGQNHLATVRAADLHEAPPGPPYETVAAAVERLPDRWILMKVGTTGDHDAVVSGQVVFASTSSGKTWRALERAVKVGGTPEHGFYVFYGEPRLVSGSDAIALFRAGDSAF